MPVRRQIGTRDFATVPIYRFAGRVWVLDIVTLRDGNSEGNSRGVVASAKRLLHFALDARQGVARLLLLYETHRGYTRLHRRLERS